MNSLFALYEISNRLLSKLNHLTGTNPIGIVLFEVRNCLHVFKPHKFFIFETLLLSYVLLSSCQISLLVSSGNVFLGGSLLCGFQTFFFNMSIKASFYSPYGAYLVNRILYGVIASHPKSNTKLKNKVALWGVIQ